MEPFFKSLNSIPLKPRTKTLYAFDFDGTLSKLVRHPDGARLTAHTRRQLESLAKLAPVVIITGRGVRDLQKRLGVRLPYLIGNHGLEGSLTTPTALRRAERHTRRWRQALEQLNLDPGVVIEDKRYSLAVHYRHAKDPSATRANLETRLRELHPQARIVGGKFVFNVVEPEAPHKGTALLRLMKKLKVTQAVYVGDDDTDEDVFALTNKNILSIRVGRKARSRAKYYIRQQDDIDRLIGVLTEAESSVDAAAPSRRKNIDRQGKTASIAKNSRRGASASKGKTAAIAKPLGRGTSERAEKNTLIAKSPRRGANLSAGKAAPITQTVRQSARARAGKATRKGSAKRPALAR